MAVTDVSFISLRLILPPVRELLKPGADFICLIKPQFEAGKENVGKNGVVRDRETHCAVIRDIVEFGPSIGLYPVGLDFSPIRGPEGNIEYLCHLRNTFAECKLDIDSVVDSSHTMN